MAVRRPGKVAAPVKQKLRKNHGPKRKMFHCWDSTTRLHFGQAGILTKYDNYESFALSCGARGVKTNTLDLWNEFYCLPTIKEKDEYLKNIKDRSIVLAQKAEKKNKK